MPRRNPKPSFNPRSPRPIDTCDHKRRYATEHEAEKVREHQELLHMGLHLRVYKCPLPGCGGWHLTKAD